MNRDTIQKLLGGYATGTLTPEEQQALFAAALDDQELFDALAREQSLRDLLRDPVAKAQVLMALDNAALPWYKKRPWLPAITAVAMAAVGLITVVVVRWQSHAPPPVIVAEMKRGEVRQAAPVPAPAIPDVEDPHHPNRGRGSASLAEPRDALKERPMAQKTQMEPRPRPAAIVDGIVGGVRAVELSPPPAVSSPKTIPAEQPVQPALIAAARKDEVSAAAPAPPLLQQAQSKSQAPYVQNQQPLGLFDGAAPNGANALDRSLGVQNARLLFYANLPVGSAGTGGRLEIAAEQDSNKKAAPAQMRAASGMVAAKSIALSAAHRGMRYSILRQQPNGEFAEAVAETVLDSGEAVRLKLVPNDYGYLFIWEAGPNGAWRQVASGPAEPLKPFETPLAAYSGAGPRQLYVQFTRNGPAGFGGAPSESLLTSLLTQARNNLIKPAAPDAAEKATYVVNRVSDPAAQQLIVPITLNYK